MRQKEKRRRFQIGPTDNAKSKSRRWPFTVVIAAGLAFAAVTLLLLKKDGRTGDAHQEGALAKTDTSLLSIGGSNHSQRAETNSMAEETTDIDKAAEAQNRGTELLAQGKISEAVAEYAKAVKFSPEDEDARYNLALALARQGDREGARKQYLEALRIYPDYVEAHNNLGNLLVKEGKVSEAIEHFKDALKISPDNASANNNLGNALARAGKLSEAILNFSEALRLKPDYLEARYNRASAYLNQQRIPEAIFEFSEVLRYQPGFEPARRGLQKAQQLQSLNTSGR